MTDRRVTALHYQVTHWDQLDYSGASRLETESDHFSATLENGAVMITMKGHHPSKEEARAVVDPFLERWEFAADLEHGPEALRFHFCHAEYESQYPDPPGTIRLKQHVCAGVPTVSARIKLSYTIYPDPPEAKIALSDAVRRMHRRYMGYRRQREPLGSLAYYCLTELEKMADEPKDRRRKAARQLRIGPDVLYRIGELSSTKGGRDARKAEGLLQPLTPEEERFLESVVPAIIQRVAEVAADPKQRRRMIALADYFGPVSP